MRNDLCDNYKETGILVRIAVVGFEPTTQGL